MSAEIKAKIDAALTDIERLPSMPAIATRLSQMASDPDVDIKALGEEISHDPAITAAIIRLSNSAYYSPVRAIRSVSEAIMTLGLQTVKTIVFVAASRGILKVDLDGYKIGATDMWDHCLVVAELAAVIARQKKTRTSEDVAFTAGLLHDTGKVVLVQFFKAVHLQVAKELEQNPQASITALEEKYCGYSHSEIGARLLSLWDFPEELVEAVRYTYRPDQAKRNPELCSIVHVANAVALSGGVGVDFGGLSEQLSKFALDQLKLTDSELMNLYSTLPEFLEKLEDLRAF